MFYSQIPSVDAFYVQQSEKSEENASRIPEIQMDTLIIWGREDAWIPQEDAFKFKAALPNATLEVIPFCGHIPQEEKPQETARLIVNFVSKKRN